jgi:hypothetical protein
MKVTIRTLAALSAVVVAGTFAAAHAQTAAAPVIAPSNCEKPADYVPLDNSSTQMARIQRRVDAYKKCVNDYAQVNNAQAQEHAVQAKAYQDAANKAIEEYNAFVNELNARTNAPK